MWRQTAKSGDESKLKELMLYVAQKCSADPDFGAIVLNKVLFFSDFISYATTGRPVTGVEYQKLRFGPAPRRLPPLRRELVEAGHAVIAPADRMGFRQERLVALREPNLDQFSGSDIAVVDAVIDQLRGNSAAAVSDISHGWSVAWDVAAEGETIPYTTAFAAPPRTPSPEEVQEAQELAELYLAME
jgi:hypothetical protein